MSNPAVQSSLFCKRQKWVYFLVLTKAPSNQKLNFISPTTVCSNSGACNFRNVLCKSVLIVYNSGNVQHTVVWRHWNLFVTFYDVADKTFKSALMTSSGTYFTITHYQPTVLWSPWIKSCESKFWSPWIKSCESKWWCNILGLTTKEISRWKNRATFWCLCVCERVPF